MTTGADGLMDRSGKSMINPYCKHALEEAIKLKETIKSLGKESDITVMSMGPPNFEQSLRQAISIGADSMYLLSDRKLAGSDTMATAKALSKLIQKIEEERGWKFDVLFAGLQTVDGDTAHVPAQIAERLKFNQVTYVEKLEYLEDKNTLKVRRMIEKGYMELEVPFPTVLTVTNVANIPRGPKLSGLMKATGSKLDKMKMVQLNIKSISDLDLKPEEVGLNGSPTVVAKVRVVQSSRPPIKIAEGENIIETVENLIFLMKEEAN
ncbi:MAG: Acryloyl-CoA reductase electron transfer subunit gamma [Candidatus Heimdallarchaeota archaeon LC_3]|nr:MAG: Acryloyl-CoA reductase electron transfer subunit gamma [Candidatus Heimdallarchaeota archaeon LC_3]